MQQLKSSPTRACSSAQNVRTSIYRAGWPVSGRFWWPKHYRGPSGRLWKMAPTSRRRFLKIASAGVAGASLHMPVRAADPVLGMIFPPANTPVPPEARMMYPSGVEFRATGVGLERMTPEGYDQVVGRIVPAAQSMAAQGANAIAVMGTSLTFYKGAAFNQDLQQKIANATALPATTMSTAIIEGWVTERYG